MIKNDATSGPEGTQGDVGINMRQLYWAQIRG